jgi:hypothetical protein
MHKAESVFGCVIVHTITHKPQASYGDGQAKLYLMSVRRIRLPDRRVAIVHQIEPCPKSQ